MIAPSPENLALARRVAAAVAAAEGRPRDSVRVELTEVREREYSKVLFCRLETDSGVQRVVAKKVRHREVNELLGLTGNQAVREFATLQVLQRIFADTPDLGVPLPLALSSEDEMSITEEVTGTQLEDAHKSTRRFWPTTGLHELELHYRRLGRWLAHFQARTRTDAVGDAPVGHIVRRLETRLGLIQDLRPEMGERIAARLAPVLPGLLQGTLRGPMPLAARHGDFGPWNVIVERDRLTVLDLFGCDIDPVPVDVLKILVDLEVERTSLTVDPRRIQRLRRAFLEGYGPPPEAGRYLVVLIEAMQRIVSAATLLCRPLALPHHRIDRRRALARHLAWFDRLPDPPTLWPGS